MNEPQRVIVTGAGRGIGYGIAACFARRGAAVLVADLEAADAEAAAGSLASSGASDAIGTACDVSDRSAVETALATAVERFGGIDVLVNNAGICPFIHGMEMTPETWRRTLDVNVTGAFHFTQLAGRQMIDQGAGGRVISITSLSENVSGPVQVDYAASKAALRMMTVSFATALGPHGITCNCIAPGMILTPMTESHWSQPTNAEFIRTRVPMGRIGTPEDIGRAAVMLASPEAEYISGVTLRVDGGHQAVCA